VYYGKDAIDPRCARYRGGSDDDWQELSSVELERGPDGFDRPRQHQALPEGFLWAEPSCQRFGMGGPRMAYGPLQKVCRTCGASFVFTAEEQKRWYEGYRLHTDVTAVHCARCRELRRAQRAYAQALEAARLEPQSAQRQLGVPLAALEVLRAGGRMALDKAFTHCRHAARLAERDEAQRLRDELRAYLASFRAAPEG
jgi:hypothetical protein